MAEAKIRELLEKPSVQVAVAAASRRWLNFVVNGAEGSPPDPGILEVGYRVSILGRALSPEYAPGRDTILTLIDGLAEAIDIHSRFERDAAEVMAALATRLYSLALQPTKMYRTSRVLADNVYEGSFLLARAVRDMAVLGGMRQAGYVGSLAAEWIGDDLASGEDPWQRLLEATLSAGDPEGHAAAIELQFGASLRSYLDLEQAIGESVTQDYVEACIRARGTASRRELLPAQRWAVSHGLLDQGSVSVTTPTGSGKTFMAELRIAAELTRDPTGLCVYVAPFNALATQVRDQLSARLSGAGWQVRLWTGAYELADSDVDLGNVLITTPEKLDFILRSSIDAQAFAEDLRDRLRLVVLDESHLIESGVRGIRYEFLVLRLQKAFRNLNMMSMSAVHATAPAFASWIEPDRARRVFLPLSWRPALTWDVLWRTDGLLDRKYDGEPVATLARPTGAKESAAFLAAQLLLRLRSVLVVDTRKDWAESLARHLFNEYSEALEGRLERNSASVTDARARLLELSSYVASEIHPDYPLVEYVKLGLAFHHAGLPPGVRRRIEELSRVEAIHTVVATTTLAEGVDLPFRAVVLVHLNLPFGRLNVAALNNIRGRAGRPFYANDGVFFIVEPSRKGTDTYQYFMDHYWEESVVATQLGSALPDLADRSPFVRSESKRAVESQLLAYFAENEVELESVGSITAETFLAQLVPPTDRRFVEVAAFSAQSVEVMLSAEAPLLRAASPLELTPLGKRVALGGLSAQSGWLSRSQVLLGVDTWPQAIRERGVNWLAVRLAWLPWEAYEHSSAYKTSRGNPRRTSLARAPDLASTLDDARLESEYSLSELLLEPRTYREMADSDDSARWLSGRTSNDKLVNAIEWASGISGVLAWTFTGVLRVLDLVAEDQESLREILDELRPFVGYFQSWVPSPVGTSLYQDGVLDRDSAVRLTRLLPASIATYTELAEWTNEHRDDVTMSLGKASSSFLAAMQAVSG